MREPVCVAGSLHKRRFAALLAQLIIADERTVRGAALASILSESRAPGFSQSFLAGTIAP